MERRFDFDPVMDMESSKYIMAGSASNNYNCVGKKDLFQKVQNIVKLEANLSNS